MLAAVDLFLVTETLVHLFVAQYPTADFTFGRQWLAFGYCPIDFLDIAVAEHVVEPFECFACLGEDNNAANGTVKAVGQANEYISRLCVLLLDVLFHGVAQRLVAGLVALDNLSGYLIYYNYMVVLVKYCHL